MRRLNLRQFGSLGHGNIARYFLALASGTMLALLISFLVQAYLSRRVSVETFGQVNYARITVGYIILALNFGFETYFLRSTVSEKLDVGRATFTQLAARLPLACLSILALTLWGALEGWSSAYLILALYSLTTLAYTFNLDWLFQARERFSALSTLNVGRSVLVLVLTVVLVRGASSANAVTYVAIVAAAELTRVAFQWAWLRPTPRRIPARDITAVLRTSIAISASFFMTAMYYNVDTLMLGHFKGATTVGIYTAAYSLLTLAIMPTNLLYQAFAPTLARNPWDWPSFKRYALATTGLALVVFLGLITLHGFAIRVVYGAKYAAAAPVLFFLSFNVLSSYVAGAFANPVNIWGHHRTYLGIVAGGALVNVALNFVLIPRFGIPAAVATTIASELVVAVTAAVFVLRGFRRRGRAAGIELETA